MLIGVWVLFELVRNIKEKNDAHVKKEKAAKDIERCWKKVKRVKDHGIQGKRIFLEE